MRGIVISPTYEPYGNDGVQISPLDPCTIRQYLLYWDKIDYPSNSIIESSIGPDQVFLESTDIFQRTRINMQGEFTLTCQLMSNIQWAACQYNNSTEPGAWSVGQKSNSLILPSTLNIIKNSYEVSLYNCLPIPTEEVSFEEILEFKSRRNSELMALRSYIDEQYQIIVSSGNSQHAILASKDRLQNAISDLQEVSNESLTNRLKDSITFDFDVPDIIAASLSGLFGGPELITYGLAAKATIGLNLKKLVAPASSIHSGTPFAVLEKINSELLR